jgi:phosphopentomutase
MSTGKDTPSGHWEMAGVPVLYEWGYFRDPQNTFPPPLLERLMAEGRLPGVLGNCHASGTEIIARLGEEHMRTGKPIVYTSADSVFQIAAHEETFGLERLIDLCLIARKLVDEYRIGRVIARPFIGRTASDFKRTGNRHDYAVPPPAPTLLDKLVASGGEVIGVGKIPDIFAHRGISREINAHGNDALFDATLAALADAPDRSLVFSNFVDFDTLYGHRRDTAGYARALEQFDVRLPTLLAQLRADDIVVLSADHGCDPTWTGTDHTRENVPVLAYGRGVGARSLGRRSTFADIGQSLAGFFGLAPMAYGTDFLS